MTMMTIADKTSEATDKFGQAHPEKNTGRRFSWIDLGVQALKLANVVGAFERGAMAPVLQRVGFSRRPSVLRPVFFFASGAIVGGAAALLFAPKTGKNLRRAITSLVTKVSNHETSDTPRKAAHNGADPVELPFPQR